MNNRNKTFNHVETKRIGIDTGLVAELRRFVDERASEYDVIAQDIWEHPEIAFQEKRSSALYRERLASQGFIVTELPELENSFVAEKMITGGAGVLAPTPVDLPIIGFMGEYDALPGMSQACSTERQPREVGAPGHACGHNLLGVGSLVAVEALVQLLESRGVAARVRYYGCPAEESLGRIPMVKAGRFSDASAILTWHPADVNTPHRYVTSANLAVVFSFKGRASHAGMAPHAGRSALDAAQLFNLSMEFMREHLEPGIMLHYVVSDGGQRPNIVPESAATFLYIRAPSAAMVRTVMARLTKAARGACLMTETSFTVEIKHGKCDYRPNETIQDALLEAMRALPLPKPSAEEKDFAARLQASVAKEDRPATLLPIGAPATSVEGGHPCRGRRLRRRQAHRRLPGHRRCVLCGSRRPDEFRHLAPGPLAPIPGSPVQPRARPGPSRLCVGRGVEHGTDRLPPRRRAETLGRRPGRIQSHCRTLPLDDGCLGF